MTAASTEFNRTLFITLPVGDVARSAQFYAALGFSSDPNFGDGEGVAAMVISDQARIMLGTHEKWAEFSKLPAANPRTHAIGLYSFAVASRDEVDTVADAATAAGGEDHDDAQDYGFMYSRSFYDLDGHGWQVMWMDPLAAELGPEEYMSRQQSGAAS